MMSEKRFTIHKESKYKEEWYAYPFCIKEDGEVVFNTIPLSIAEEVRDKLNEQQATIDQLNLAIDDLLSHTSCDEIKKENEQLKQKVDFYKYFQKDARELEKENEQLKQIIELQEEIQRLEKMIWKIQWRFQQEVGIEKARKHYQEIDKEMNE